MNFACNTDSGSSSYLDQPETSLPAYGEHKQDTLSEAGPSIEGTKKGYPIGLEKELPTPIPYSDEDGDGDALMLLADFDTVLLVDDSTSMGYNDDRKTYVEDAYVEPCRWTEARNAVASLARRAAKYDKDGIDVLFLNNETTKRKNTNLTSEEDVKKLFMSVELYPSTYLGKRLEGILRNYMKDIKKSKIPFFGSKVKPLNLIIITDGASQDSVIEPIRSIASQLDKHHLPVTQVGIQFIQIGRSREAAEHLRQVDDDLEKWGIRDIADTTPYTGAALTTEILVKMLVGGINRQYDRRGTDGKRVAK